MLGAKLLLACSLLLLACQPAAPTATTPLSPIPTGSTSPVTAPAAAARPTPAPPATVHAGLHFSVSDAGILLGIEHGYFEEQQLQVELEQFASAAAMIPPLNAAQIDVGGTSFTPGILNAFARGVRPRIVADKGYAAPGYGYQGVAIRQALWDSGEVRGAAELRGRKVARPAARSSAELGLERALRLGGLTLEDVDATTLSFPDSVAALAAGSIDAALSIEPFLTQIAAQRIGVIWKREDEYYPNHQLGLLYYAEPFVTQRSEVARRFMVGYLRGVREYNDAFSRGDAARRAAVVAVLAKHTTVKEPALYDQMVMPALNPDGVVHVDSLREDAEAWLASGDQQERVNLTEVVDETFARYAREQLGPYR